MPRRSDLQGLASALAMVMSDISEEVYAAGWLIGTEWVLWQALLDWRETGQAYWPRGEFSADISGHMSAIDALQRAAGGWVWWLDGETFVPEPTWLRLVGLREQHQHDKNERLWERLQEEARDDVDHSR